LAVKRFLAPDSPARTLHAALLDYNEQAGVGSWLDDFWDSRYLGRRDRIAQRQLLFAVRRHRANPSRAAHVARAKTAST
jgi:carnitine O-acetyltransferase